MRCPTLPKLVRQYSLKKTRVKLGKTNPSGRESGFRRRGHISRTELIHSRPGELQTIVSPLSQIFAVSPTSELPITTAPFPRDSEDERGEGCANERRRSSQISEGLK
eukprot:5694955-Pyramimonas_sp.AAC.1